MERKVQVIVYTIIVVIATILSGCEEPAYDVPITAQEEEKAMSDFTVKPVEEYPGYYKGAGNIIYGIPADAEKSSAITPVYPVITVEGKDQRRIPDEFFTLNSVLYMKVSLSFPAVEEGGEPEMVVKYCSQVDGVISYLTKTKFPAVPKSERIAYDDGTLSVYQDSHDGIPISVCEREYNEPLYFVDSVMRVKNGYLIGAPEGRGSSRPAGILYWPDGERRMTKWKDPGRMWTR